MIIINMNLIYICIDDVNKSHLFQRHRQLLSAHTGLVKRRVLDYDRSTDRLLVVNQSSSACLFDVTRGQ
jgi:hypothetical protein